MNNQPHLSIAPSQITDNYIYSNYDEEMVCLLNQVPLDKYTHVFGIVRGGLIAGVSLSHHLDIPFVPVYFNKDENTANINTSHNFGLSVDSIVLLVDDIVDSGETMIYTADQLSKEFFIVDTAALYQKETAQMTSDYYAKFIPIELTNNWVIFPWEKNK